MAEHRIAIRKLLAAKPDMTLAELREALGLKCTLPALHYVLADMNLTFKKRRSGLPSRTAMTSAAQDDAVNGLEPTRLVFLDESGATSV